jgi:hypothetical protein
VEAAVDSVFGAVLRYSPGDQSTEGGLINLDKVIWAEYLEIFEEPKALLPRRLQLGVDDFQIRLTLGAKPPYRLLYRMIPAEREEYIKQVSTFKGNSLIRESQSPFAAPLLFMPKSPYLEGWKDLRMVLDYRALNEITVKDRFPLPLPEELIERLQGKNISLN